MKKDSYFTKFMRFLVVVVFAVVVSACSLQKNVGIQSINVDEDSVPEYILAGEFDEAGIEAIITYDDGTTETLNITSELLSEAQREILNRAGEYEIEILFKGVSTKLRVKIVEREEFHQVRFFNGFNQLVSLQLVKDGVDAEEPTGQAHLITGYEFIGWDRTFQNIEEDIDVYAVYSKITEISSNINEIVRELRWTVSLKMDDYEYVNELIINENDSTKTLTTYDKSYENESVSATTKITGPQTDTIYSKWFRNTNDTHYFLENVVDYGDHLGAYTIEEISSDEYFQEYYIYNKLLNVGTGGSEHEYFIYHTNEEPLYKIIYTYADSYYSNGYYSGVKYEVLFNDEQILSIKKYLFDSPEEFVLDSTVYYFINPAEEERVVFPEVEDE